jgi:hypothetical protein
LTNKKLSDKQHENIDNIPLFPLGIVVLPGETRFLHIFEQRYKNLFEDIEALDNRFGIPFVSKGRMDGIGSLVKFEKTLAKYPNGEVDIAVKGIDLLTIKSYNTEHPERFYPYGDIETLDKNTIIASSSLLNAFDKYNEKVLKLDLTKYPQMNFYVIANSVGLSDLEKYDLLIRETDEAINRTLINHLRLRTILASQQNSLQEYYCLN